MRLGRGAKIGISVAIAGFLVAGVAVGAISSGLYSAQQQQQSNTNLDAQAASVITQCSGIGEHPAGCDQVMMTIKQYCDSGQIHSVCGDPRLAAYLSELQNRPGSGSNQTIK